MYGMHILGYSVRFMWVHFSGIFVKKKHFVKVSVFSVCHFVFHVLWSLSQYADWWQPSVIGGPFWRIDLEIDTEEGRNWKCVCIAIRGMLLKDNYSIFASQQLLDKFKIMIFHRFLQRIRNLVTKIESPNIVQARIQNSFLRILLERNRNKLQT